MRRCKHVGEEEEDEEGPDQRPDGNRLIIIITNMILLLNYQNKVLQSHFMMSLKFVVKNMKIFERLLKNNCHNSLITFSLGDLMI